MIAPKCCEIAEMLAVQIMCSFSSLLVCPCSHPAVSTVSRFSKKNRSASANDLFGRLSPAEDAELRGIAAGCEDWATQGDPAEFNKGQRIGGSAETLPNSKGSTKTSQFPSMYCARACDQVCGAECCWLFRYLSGWR